MSQFDVYKNMDTLGNTQSPLLLNVQTDFLDSLDTRVIIPLMPIQSYPGKPVSNLHPVFEISGKEYIAVTALMRSVQSSQIGEKVSTLKGDSDKINTSLDFVFSGF